MHQIINQAIDSDLYSGKLCVKREDLIHPLVSGNKFRKLKYNILELKAKGCTELLTFGGAYSNHIAATAYACKIARIGCIGVIRGEELEHKIASNPTLSFAQSCGMQLRFVTRQEYNNKTDKNFVTKLLNLHQNTYLLPEGGTNSLAVKGCQEILTPQDYSFDYICCAVGTGGTIAGIINSAKPHQKIIGFPALKGDFLADEIRKFAVPNNWQLISDYHFGGYAKVTPELISFINNFYKKNKVPLDPVYTAKMVYGVMDLIKNNFFTPNASILMIHTGGLQGIKGMNEKLENKKMNKIEFYE